MRRSRVCVCVAWYALYYLFILTYLFMLVLSCTFRLPLFAVCTLCIRVCSYFCLCLRARRRRAGVGVLSWCCPVAGGVSGAVVYPAPPAPPLRSSPMTMRPSRLSSRSPRRLLPRGMRGGASRHEIHTRRAHNTHWLYLYLGHNRARGCYVPCSTPI